MFSILIYRNNAVNIYQNSEGNRDIKNWSLIVVRLDVMVPDAVAVVTEKSVWNSVRE
jgi:hypothetical protein